VTDQVPDTGFIRSKDGTQLHYATLPNKDAKATLLFVHGYGEHSGRYAHVMSWFHDRGYDVAAFDYRGHGKSEGVRGHVTRYREYMDDLDAFISSNMGRLPQDRKVYLVGHSNGGLVTASYILEQPEGIDGAVLSSPMLGFAVKINPLKSLLGKAMSTLYPTLALPSEIPLDHLSTDKSVGEAYGVDPLVHKVATARWYTEALAQQAVVLRNADRIQVPILLMQAGSDKVVDAEVSQNFLAAVGSADKELRWYDGLYHEIFNETIKEEVFSDLDAWLKKHL
jgi:lysophospholipase